MPAPTFSPRAPAAIALLSAVLSFGLILLMRTLGLLQLGELAIYDAQLRRASAQSREAPPIALVLIDEQDIRRLGHPLTDTLMRQLIARLLAAEPRAVGIDLYRDQPVPPADGDPRLDTEEYLALGRTVASDDRVIMVLKFPDPGRFGTPKPRFLRDDLQVGFSDLPVDPGGAIRRGLLFMWDGDRPLISLSLQVVLRYLRPENIGLGPAADDSDQIRLGKTVVAPLHQGFGPYVRVDDGGYQFLLDYGWGLRGMPSYGLSEVLEGEVPPEAFRDRIVLVGTAAASVKDSFFTPHSRGAAGQPMYGVEVHAQAADQLIRYATGASRPLAAPTAPAIAAWILLWAVVGGGVGAFGRSVLADLAVGLTAVAALFASVVVAFSIGWWLPLLAPLLAGFGSAALTFAIESISERRQRRQLSALFSRFQGPAIAEEIWQRRQEFVGPEGRPVSRQSVVTTLMADLEGYTAASEHLGPEALMRWVSEYLATAAAAVEAHRGVVDDYAGDGIKANFGFPAPSRSEREIDAAAEDAVRAALAIGRGIETLNDTWRQRGLPTARARIGIFTGEVVVGFIGGDRALKYTSVGASVNTASRLEQFRKDAFANERDSAWRILVGEETARRTRGLFELAPLGEHALDGIAHPLPIYRVLGAA